MKKIFIGMITLVASISLFASDRIEMVKTCQSYINLNSLDGNELFKKCVSDGRSPEVVNACGTGTKLLVTWDKVLFFIRCLESDADANLVNACIDLAKNERTYDRPYFMLTCIGE